MASFTELIDERLGLFKEAIKELRGIVKWHHQRINDLDGKVGGFMKAFEGNSGSVVKAHQRITELEGQVKQWAARVQAIEGQEAQPEVIPQSDVTIKYGDKFYIELDEHNRRVNSHGQDMFREGKQAMYDGFLKMLSERYSLVKRKDSDNALG